MFLIPASSCLARLHHSLLINRFLLPSSPSGRPLTPRWGCRTRTLPRAAPGPQEQPPPQPPPDRGSRPAPRREPPTSSAPRGRALESSRGGRVGSGPEPGGRGGGGRGAELQREAPSGARVGVRWGHPLPLGASEGVTWHPGMGREHAGKDMQEGSEEGSTPSFPTFETGSSA